MSNDDKDWREEDPQIDWRKEDPQIDWSGGQTSDMETVMRAQASQLQENHWVRHRRSWAFGILWVMLFGCVTSFAVIEGYQTANPEQVVLNEVESWMIIDERGIIRNLSLPMANLLGCHPSQLIGEPLERLLPAKYRTRHYDAFSRAIQGHRKGVFVVRSEILSYDGKHETPVEIRARVFATAKGYFGKASITATSDIVTVRNNNHD